MIRAQLAHSGLLLPSRRAASLPHKPPKPDPVVARVLPPPTPRTDGAIYQAGQQIELFADLKARRVGDVLTIRLTETTSASKSAVTKTAKTTAVNNTGPTILGQNHHGIAACRFSPRPWPARTALTAKARARRAIVWRAA